MSVRRFARVVLIAALALAMVSCTKWPEKKNPTWKSATSGEQLANLFWQDVKSKNWKSLEGRMAPLMLAMNANAVSDRAATLEHLKAMTLESFQIGEVHTEPAGADLVVTYTIVARGSLGGQPLPSAPIRMMSVWQQVKHGYILVAHSSVVTAQ